MAVEMLNDLPNHPRRFRLSINLSHLHPPFQIVKSFSDNGHYDAQLFDDIADSITYCNHYLAPVKVPTDQVVNALTAYAKFGHDRGDLFVSLTR